MAKNLFIKKIFEIKLNLYFEKTEREGCDPSSEDFVRRLIHVIQA